MLTERIDEHVPMTMLEQQKVSGVTKKAKEDSAITHHFGESFMHSSERRTHRFVYSDHTSAISGAPGCIGGAFH